MTRTNSHDRAGHLSARPDLANYLAHRPDLVDMIREAEIAALMPQDPGGLGFDLRAGLAGRIARLNGAEELADGYLEYLPEDTDMPLADPGNHHTEDRLTSGILAFADKVATRPRDVVAADIDALRDAGIPEPDIVRLAELVAFVSFQLRVLQGAALMETQA